MTHEIFLKGLALIVSTFRVNPEKETIKVWEMLIEDLNDEEFMAAVLRICRNVVKFPGDNLAALTRQESERQRGMVAEEAWGKVLNEIARTGRYGIPHFADETITRAVMSLGWINICDTENKNMNTLRAHFYRAYEANLTRIQTNQVQKMISDSKEVRSLVSGISKALSAPEITY